MEALRVPERSSWENRFGRPTGRDLLRDLEKEQQTLVQYTRSALSQLPQMGEELKWMGVPWRWCFAYVWGEGAARAFAYVIPKPGKAGLAVPIESDIVNELPTRRLPKHVREGVLTAPQVGGVLWCQWDLASKGQVDDILNLAKLKLPDAGGARA